MATAVHDASQDWEGTVKRAQSSLIEFTRFTKRDYIRNWHHELLAAELDRIVTGEIRRLMVILPPQHGKSELVSRRLPAYALGKNPNEKIIGCSYGMDLAKMFNRAVQRIIDEDAYRILFSGTRLHEIGAKATGGHHVRTSDYFELVGREGYYRCSGRGGGIAGHTATLVLIDDLLKDQSEAFSAAAREECWRLYTGEIQHRIPNDGRIVVVNTRRHRDDLCGRLLREEPDRWRVVCLPALARDTQAHPDDPRKEGEALWPHHKSREALERERALDRATFAAVCQGDPSEAGGTDWPPELFGEWIWCKGPQSRLNPHGWPADFDLRVVACDPSKGRQDKPGDYTAIIFLGLKDRLLYVDAVVERIPMARISDRIITFCDQWHPHGVAVEGDQFQEFLCHDLRAKLGDRYGLDWGIEPIMSEGVKKEARIRRLSPFIVDRQLRFRADAESSGCRLLIEQLLDFPTGEHDDGPDALEMAVRKANRIMAGQWS